jgi:hypothetical protein
MIGTDNINPARDHGSLLIWQLVNALRGEAIGGAVCYEYIFFKHVASSTLFVFV